MSVPGPAALPYGAANRKIDLLPYAVGLLTIFVLVVFMIYPILKTIMASFVENGQELAFTNLTLVNFERFLEGALFTDALWHSITVGALTTIVSTVLALPAAYAVARVTIPFRNIILALMVVPIIAPPFIGAYSWIILLGRRGIITHFLDSWFGIEMPSLYGLYGIVLALSLHYFPYIFLFVQGALAASDPYIEESAQIMGARRSWIIRTITLPLVLPTIAAGALIVLAKALGNFGVPAILGGEYYVLPTLIYYQIHGFFDLNAASAIALVNVLITLIAILVLGRINRRRNFVTVTSVTRRSKQHSGLAAQILANGYIWLLLLFALLPQIIIVFSSFAERWGGTLLPTEYGFSNYLTVWEESRRPIFNSLILASAATIMCVVFGSLAAYTSVRRKFFGKWALDLTIMLPFIIPGIVTGVAFLTTFNTGFVVLTGTATIIVLAYFTRRIAYIFRSVSASIIQVDNKIEEASAICGATWGWTMRKVTLPLIAPGILAGSILVFSTLITEMSVTIILYSARWKTIAISIFEQLTSDDVLEASTVGSIAIVMTLILVFSASKLIGKSMADMFR
jgi:iron(III) transport system permease protein